MKRITKRFPGVLANDQVDLALYPGEIHALLGENGAGKSTLMNILTGIYMPNDGCISLAGRPVDIKNPKDAVLLGIGMVHQHFKLIHSLSVAENILLCSGKCGFILNQKKMNRQIRECAERFGLNVEPSAKIWQLSVGEQQRVAIVKQLFLGADLLILDEPTAVLTPQEAAALFRTLRAMAEQGKTVLFITHKLNEVMAYADRITVLRNGRSIGTMPAADTDRQALARMMVGRQLQNASDRRRRTPVADRALCIENMSVMGDRGVAALEGVSLEVHRGEILGIAGVAGNGQRELCETLGGLRRPASGVITLGGEDITGYSARQCADIGIGLIPEDRIGTGMAGSLDMSDNAILRDYNCPPCSQYGILNKKGIAKRVEGFVAQYEIKSAGTNKPVSLMSGGNLQKLLIARELNGEPQLLVAAHPTRGVDIGATKAIHELLLRQRERGAAILLVSEDLEELFELSDRVAVLYGGRVTGVVEIDDAGQAPYEDVGRLMLGILPGQAKAGEARYASGAAG